MGTNYYIGKNLCKCCKRWDEDLHIGKFSYGWAFTFKAHKYLNLTSWDAWKTHLQDKMIFDEYGHRITLEEFVEMIEDYGSPNYTLDTGARNRITRQRGNDWYDCYGYYFTEDYFS